MALVIGVVPGVTPDRWVRVWGERRPDVPLRVVPVDDGAAAVRRADVRMAFARLAPDLDAEGLHVIPLWEETPVVVAARGHPVQAFKSVTEADLAGEEVRPGWDDAALDQVAAGHGVARMPQSVFRATGRRALVARPVVDGGPTTIGLVWLRSSTGEEVDGFIGVVRGRTANSSRGSAPEPAPVRAADRRPRRPSGRRRG